MTATEQAPNLSTATDQPRGRPASPGRIAAIDIARGLALLGMFTVHVAIDPLGKNPPGETAAWMLDAPSGQASVLFFILSGVSLSVIATRGSSSAQPGVLMRRGAVLMIGGLLLSATIWSASILEHYGVMFLLAPWMLRLSDKTLTRVTVASMAAGPVLLLVLGGRSFAVGEELGLGVLGWLWATITGLALDGTYPLVVWIGFFLLGVRLGRFDLSSTRVAGTFLAAGMAAALLVGWSTSTVVEATDTDLYGAEAFGGEFGSEFGSASGAEESADSTAPSATGKLLSKLNAGSITELEFAEKVFDVKYGGGDGFGEFGEFGGSEADRRPVVLLDTSGHSGRTGWVLGSSAVAVAILGAALLLPKAAQRVLRPLAAMGSISLTSYLLHIFLVTDGWRWIVGEEPELGTGSQILTLVGLQLTLVAVASLIVWRWRTGPAELGLKALAQPRRAGS